MWQQNKWQAIKAIIFWNTLKYGEERITHKTTAQPCPDCKTINIINTPTTAPQLFLRRHPLVFDIPKEVKGQTFFKKEILLSKLNLSKN